MVIKCGLVLHLFIVNDCCCFDTTCTAPLFCGCPPGFLKITKDGTVATEKVLICSGVYAQLFIQELPKLQRDYLYSSHSQRVPHCQSGLFWFVFGFNQF